MKLTPASPGRVKRVLEDYFELSDGRSGSTIQEAPRGTPEFPAHWLRWRCEVGAIMQGLRRRHLSALLDWWAAFSLERSLRTQLEKHRRRHERLVRHLADLKLIKGRSSEPQVVEFAIQRTARDAAEALGEIEHLERALREATRALDRFRRRRAYHQALEELGIEFARRRIRPILRRRRPGSRPEDRPRAGEAA